PGCDTDRHDRLLRIDETDAHRALEIVDDAYAAYDGGGLYRASVRLVVKGHVAGHYREVERQTGGPHPFDAADELPHCLRPLGVAEVHVVGDRQRPRTYCRKVPPRLGNGLHPSRHRIGNAISRGAVASQRQTSVSAMDSDNGSVPTSSLHRVGHDHLVVLFPNPG